MNNIWFFSVDTFWFALLWFGVTQQGKGLFRFFSGDFCFQLQIFWSIFWGFFLAFSKISIKSGISFRFSAKFLTCISFWALEMGSGLWKNMGWGSILIHFVFVCCALHWTYFDQDHSPNKISTINTPFYYYFFPSLFSKEVS